MEVKSQALEGSVYIRSRGSKNHSIAGSTAEHGVPLIIFILALQKKRPRIRSGASSFCVDLMFGRYGV